MILVRNRPRRSNGSNIFWLILALFGLLMACNPTRKVVSEKEDTVKESDRPQVYNPRTRQYEDANAENTRVDTISWQEIVDPERGPITDQELAKTIPYSELKSTYNISLLLPLRGAMLAPSQKKVSTLLERFIHYYKGFTMGLNKLEREGINLDVNIIDVESRRLLDLQEDPAIVESDLIIGPYRREHIEQLAPLVDQYKIPMVTPWSSFTNLAEENPYIILPKPGFEIYCKHIVDHIMATQNPRDVRIVLREGDEYLYNFFHQFMEPYGIEDTSQSFRTYMVQDTTLELSETPVDSHLVEDRNNVFIIPYYRNADQRFVYSFLRRLSIGNLNYEVFVYGMPQWKPRVELDFDLYNNMKIYIPTTGLAKTESWDYQQIKDAFIREYGLLPSDDALEAYDLIVYLGRMLFKYGKNFQYYMEEDPYLEGVYSGFQFSTIDPPFISKSVDDRLLGHPGFENRFVQLIQLKDYRFQNVK